MSRNYRTSFRTYTAWNYQKEIDDLNRASEQGWQLIKGGCFHSRFVKNTDIQYRYQLDYQKVEDMARYLETFREQGWEYVNSTFNGWHYFRKLYDPARPEEAYEIFTDRESLQMMTGRWARFAMIISSLLCIMALFHLYRMIRKPQLPNLLLLIMLIIECAVLLRGALLMRNPEDSHSRHRDTAFFYTFIAVILIGAAGSITLQMLRPAFSTGQSADSIDKALVDERWMDFEIRYPDFYYLDLEMHADAPMTFAVLNETGETVYTRTDTDFQKDDIRLKLSRGKYCYSLSCETGFDLNCSIS